MVLVWLVHGEPQSTSPDDARCDEHCSCVAGALSAQHQDDDEDDGGRVVDVAVDAWISMLQIDRCAGHLHRSPVHVAHATDASPVFDVKLPRHLIDDALVFVVVHNRWPMQSHRSAHGSHSNGFYVDGVADASTVTVAYFDSHRIGYHSSAPSNYPRHSNYRARHTRP